MSTPMSKGVSILDAHDTVHEDVLKAWEENRSVAVISQHHAVFDGREELIASYDGPPALITWTTGTTGRPKGVAIPWAAVDARCRALAQYWSAESVARTTCLISPSNALGIITGRLAAGYSGGQYVPKCGAGVTCLISSPRILKAMMRPGHPFNPVGADDFRDMKASIRLVIAGGHAMTHADKVFLEDGYGVPVVSYYATSETGVISLDGRLAHGCEARIKEKKIQIRTAGLANGYLGDGPLLMDDGWFVTPDNGAIEDERLIFLGRCR